MESENNQQPMQQQFTQPPVQPKKKKKTWLIIVIVLAVLIVIGAVAGGGDDNKKVVTPADSTVNADGETSGTTALSEQKISTGNSVSSDDIKITYKSCNANYTDYNEFAAPADGNKIIRVEFEFENISNADQTISTLDCYADGTACESYYGAGDYKSSFTTISAGRKSTAIEYFEVPKDAETIEIEFEDNFWTESKILFVVE